MNNMGLKQALRELRENEGMECPDHFGGLLDFEVDWYEHEEGMAVFIRCPWCKEFNLFPLAGSPN